MMYLSNNMVQAGTATHHTSRCISVFRDHAWTQFERPFSHSFCFICVFLQAEATLLSSRSFPPESFALQLNTPGDLAVVKLSEMVLNDLPTADPRWSEGAPQGACTCTE